MSSFQKRQEVAREVLAYYLRNPDGADDLRGVTNWRLLDQLIHHALEETRDALEWLVEKDYLVVDSTPGSKRIFRLNSERREEALLFVGKDDSGEESRQES